MVLSEEKLREIYTRMCLAREFEDVYKRQLKHAD